MARRLCQFLLALAVLYALAVGVFATFGYVGERPDVLTIASDLHRWVTARFAPAPPTAPAPGEVPPERPPPVAPPAVPPVETPAAPVALDERGLALERVEKVLLPQAERELKALADRGTADFEDKRSTVLVTLTQARDLLGDLLDRRRDDPEAQRLYKRVSDLLIAVKKR